MSDVLEEIRKKVGNNALSNSCKKHGCRVSFQDMPSRRIIYDVDRGFTPQQTQGNRCDYVLFFESVSIKTVFAIPVELKSGDVDASQASKQLQRGLDIANSLIPATTESSCYPILFHGKKLHPKQRYTLNRSKVSFRGRKLTIITSRCNRPKNLAIALGANVIAVLNKKRETPHNMGH